MKKRNTSARPTRARRYDPSAEIPNDFNPGASKPGGTIKPRLRTGSERYKAEGDLIEQLDRMVKDGEK